jgi:quercetin dioxygenase-like cupin family protein
MFVKNYREAKAQPVVAEPGVTVYWLVSQLAEEPHFALRLYELEPGARTATHTHYWEREAFVLSGKGAMVGDGGTIPLTEGDVIYVPPGEQHRFVNASDRVLRFLMVLPIVHQNPTSRTER